MICRATRGPCFWRILGRDGFRFFGEFDNQFRGIEVCNSCWQAVIDHLERREWPTNEYTVSVVDQSNVLTPVAKVSVDQILRGHSTIQTAFELPVACLILYMGSQPAASVFGETGILLVQHLELTASDTEFLAMTGNLSRKVLDMMPARKK